MAADYYGSSIALILLTASLVLLVNFSLTVFALFKKRWQLLKLTESIEDAGLKYPHFLYGNLHELPTEEKDRISDFIRRSRSCENTSRLWIGPFDCIITMINPEYVRLALANADTKDTRFHHFLLPWLGDGLLLSGGPKWMRHRRLLTPAFHFEILRPYAKLFTESTKMFLDKVDQTEGEFFDVFHLVSKMTLDSLFKCSFSYESNCQINEDNSYIKSVYALSELFIARMRYVPYHNDFIFRLSPMGRKYYGHCKIVHDKADATIRERRAELERMKKGGLDSRKGKYLDFLDILLKAKDEDGNGLKDLEIRQEVDTFLFEGHDTTASAISWCLYDLGRHPNYQQKCREEIDGLLKDRDTKELNWDDMNKLPFTTMCIKESLRIHPPVPTFGRTLVKDVILPNGLTLPKGIDEDGNGLKDLEIRQEVDTFLFEGHDTTASAISWCLYDLGRHPNYQQKCREEIDGLLKDRDTKELNWDDMNKLPFTTMCIKESLRIHPPVPTFGRTLVKDVILPNGLTLPKGTTVGVSPPATQLHPLYWKDPDVFNPSRFTAENSRDRHSHAFFSFSAGPRNCIGQHFAMNEIKIAIALTLHRFQVSPDPDRPPVQIFRMVLRTLNGLYLRFTPRMD
ncbi:cytochrome P450 4A24-like [Amphiura filiformis]|uniref:cytochrome P450 4A24-like n=1 Tax=Amphiura filiformis TaxID=82378 RepID=UPI003B216209